MVTDTISVNESNFLYRLLVSSVLRWARYLILFGILGVISLNQVFICFGNYRTVLGGWIYALIFLYLLTYAIVVYLNRFILLPRYLLEKRYLTYLSLLSGAMIMALLTQMLIEYFINSHWPQIYARGYYFSIAMVMDYISSFVLTMLCIIGGTMTVLLKLWMIDNQQVSQLEKAHILSEVEQLKEQVSPELLFKTLHHSGVLTLTEPDKASNILMKLSQLLRYQLYDCARTKVLLSSEISFLTNFLTLEQSSISRFEYSFTSEGEVNRILVPPLLFIPFVRQAVRQIHEIQKTKSVLLEIHLQMEENTIIFTCFCSEVNLSVSRGLEQIRQRLDFLYGSNYELLFTVEGIVLKLKGGHYEGK